jgi:hypothetical protein
VIAGQKRQMDDLEILETAALAIDALIEGEQELFAVDVNERSLSARLAIYLQHKFPDWHVDCEYNRLGDGIKRLPRPEESRTDDSQGRTIYPDIIVHRRGERANLLVIEVKKHDNDDTDRDIQKLEGLTSPDGEYAYRLGIHLVFDCSRGIVSNIMVYSSGGIDRVSFWLKCRLFGPETRAVLDKATAEFERQLKKKTE